MDPVYLVPMCRAKRYDGTLAAAEDIAAWVGLDIVEATEEMLRLRVAHDEVTWIPVGHWALAMDTVPARIVDVMPDDALQARYVLHPGPVTLPTPPPVGPVTP